MKRQWHKHRALVGYIFIVAAAMLAVSLHQDRTTAQLDKRDARSCEQRNILFTNQRLVLHSLTLLVELESDEEHTTFERLVLKRQIDRLREALLTAQPREC